MNKLRTESKMISLLFKVKFVKIYNRKCDCIKILFIVSDIMSGRHHHDSVIICQNCSSEVFLKYYHFYVSLQPSRFEKRWLSSPDFNKKLKNKINILKLIQNPIFFIS